MAAAEEDGAIKVLASTEPRLSASCGDDRRASIGGSPTADAVSHGASMLSIEQALREAAESLSTISEALAPGEFGLPPSVWKTLNFASSRAVTRLDEYADFLSADMELTFAGWAAAQPGQYAVELLSEAYTSLRRLDAVITHREQDFLAYFEAASPALATMVLDLLSAQMHSWRTLFRDLADLVLLTAGSTVPYTAKDAKVS